jgi:hypothetical protein
VIRPYTIAFALLNLLLTNCTGPTEVAGPGSPRKAKGRSAAVSTTFAEAETRELHRRVTSPGFRERLKAYTCGDVVRPFEVTLAFWPERETNERLVFVYTDPELGGEPRDLCLAIGFEYEVDRQLALMDHGAMVTYTVKDPITGDLREIKGTRQSPRRPICDCSRRGEADGSWVNLEEESSR